MKLDKLIIFVTAVLIFCIHCSLNDKHTSMLLLQTSCSILKTKSSKQ